MPPPSSGLPRSLLPAPGSRHLAFLTSVLRPLTSSFFLLISSFCIQHSAFSSPPPWWTSRGVLDPNATPDDYAPVNAGQLKNMAKALYDEIEFRVPGGPSPALYCHMEALAATPDDYVVINIGQLKNVVKPFYDFLAPFGGPAVPWPAPGLTADDYAPANLGQLKNVFAQLNPASLPSVPYDIDFDGVPDEVETTYGCDGSDPRVGNVFTAWDLAHMMGLPSVGLSLQGSFVPSSTGTGTNSFSITQYLVETGLYPSPGLAPCVVGSSEPGTNGRLQYLSLQSLGSGDLRVHVDHYSPLGGTNRFNAAANLGVALINSRMVGNATIHPSHDVLSSSVIPVGSGFGASGTLGYRASNTNFTDGGYAVIDFKVEPSLPLIVITPSNLVVAAGSATVTYQAEVQGLDGSYPLELWWGIFPKIPGGAHFGSSSAPSYYHRSTTHTVQVHPGNAGHLYSLTARPRGIASHAGTAIGGAAMLTVLKVEVTNIKFNHDAGSSVSDALNIRKDYDNDFDISSGEWVKNSVNIPACYTTNKTVTIKTRFTVQPASLTSADIWAVSLDSGGALGDVIKTNVTFSAGVSNPEYVTLKLSGTTPGSVNKSTTDSWKWKMKNMDATGSPDSDLNTSGPHIIYTILNEPVPPWLNIANNKGNAWTVILDSACTWAAGSSDETNVVAMITSGSYSGFGKTYDGSLSHTFGTHCNLSEMLSDNFVDCRDMSAVVQLFTNIVGGSGIWVRKVDGIFSYKRILPIGTSTWAAGGWNFHQFGWFAGSVSDACVKLQESAPYIPIHDNLNGS